MRQLPNEGNYIGECIGNLTLVETEKGALQVCVPYKLTDCEVQFTGLHRATIGKTDGTLMQSTIDSLKTIFGWDGADPWMIAFEDDGVTPRDHKGKTFQLDDCKHESYQSDTGERVSFKPSWINPIGGGMNVPVMADRKSVQSKWASRFRAASKQVKPATITAPAGPSKGPSKPKPPTTPCAMEDAWTACCEANKGKDEAAMSAIWYAKILEILPDVPETKHDKLSKEQYGQLRAAFAA